MKNLCFFALLIISSCSADEQSEKEAIQELVNLETEYAASGDTARWMDCWLPSNDFSVIYISDDEFRNFTEFSSFADDLAQNDPFELDITRGSWKFVIGSDEAFVSFKQTDNWVMEGRRHTKENRTLKKIDGVWKLTSSEVMVISTYEDDNHESFHMLASQIPANPVSGFTNLYNKGGMSIGYIDAGGPMDFSPLFEGLPGNMCNSPHWGYIIDGAVRIQYPDGSEDQVTAGEVFYWPAPHTGIIDKSVKLVDFSPDHEFIPLMQHIGEITQQ